jgi:outer membrane biosynthesis protein TonB
MVAKTQKSALNATLKAEEKKVMAKKPAATSKVTKLTPRAAKPAPKPTPAKQAAQPAPKPQPKKAETPKVEKKQPKQKVVRDSFTMPEDEYSMIAALKKKCLAAGVAVKKSELLRAGLKVLSGMTQANLSKHLSELAEIKTGRPAKAKKGK